ncbi:MAG: asparagine synthase (glutamine-hydrolyzing) [Planctomycetes bacterium]|nr:asparagine synthase (glutamine-hydrolyzing) [Planctomycetota bacterium]
MCGICGILDARPGGSGPQGAILAAMNETLRPRGPDEEGSRIEGPVGLAMRRLRIIDLAGGQQPIENETGTVRIVFNGEIYNFSALRRGLEARGHRFRTRSDTEVIVHLYEEKGVDCVHDLNGMFAFAIWDADRRRLFIARDRAGEKPLYYRAEGGLFVFGSELKAVLAHPETPRRVDLAALARYLVYECVPAPWCILQGVRKLGPGERLTVDAATGKVAVDRWWAPAYGPETGPFDEAAAAEELWRRLRESVRDRLESEVPLGVFLSGGIDSSAVVTCMSEARGGPAGIKTFSIGFDDPSFDESRWSDLVAARLGTEHHKIVVTPAAVLDCLPKVVDFLDEPLGDASILPSYVLARVTRQHVTVALGGDGGDELFAGYPTFPAHRWALLFERLPRAVRAAVGWGARRMPVSHRDYSLDYKVKTFLKGMPYPPLLRHPVWLSSFTPEAALDLFTPEARRALGGEEAGGLLGDVSREAPGGGGATGLHDVLRYYFRFYLGDDVLVKVDRASMANSLEVRAPFLDAELMGWVNGLPAAAKLGGRTGRTTKALLKRAARGRVPDEIIDRPKKGFGMPVARWLRAELKGRAAEVLDEKKIDREGILRGSEVRRLLAEHQAGVRDNRKALWTLLIYRLWAERWLEGGGR